MSAFPSASASAGHRDGPRAPGLGPGARTVSSDIVDVTETVNTQYSTIRMLRQQLQLKDSLIDAWKERVEVLEKDRVISERQISMLGGRLHNHRSLERQVDEMTEDKDLADEELRAYRERCDDLTGSLGALEAAHKELESSYIQMCNDFKAMEVTSLSEISEKSMHNVQLTAALQTVEARNALLKAKLKQAEASLSESRTKVKEQEKELEDFQELKQKYQLTKASLEVALTNSKDLHDIHHQIEANTLSNMNLQYEYRTILSTLSVASAELSSMFSAEGNTPSKSWNNGIDENKSTQAVDEAEEDVKGDLFEKFKINSKGATKSLRSLLKQAKRNAPSQLKYLNEQAGPSGISSTISAAITNDSSPLSSLLEVVLKMLQAFEQCAEDRSKLHDDLQKTTQSLNMFKMTVEKMSNRITRYRGVFQMFDLTLPSLASDLEAVLELKHVAKFSTVSSSPMDAIDANNTSDSGLSSKDRMMLLERLNRYVVEIMTQYNRIKITPALLDEAKNGIQALKSQNVTLQGEIEELQRISKEAEFAVQVLEDESKAEIYRIRTTYDAKLALKVQEMALEGADAIHGSEVCQRQVQDLKCIVHRLMAYILQLQRKYTDLVTQKAMLMRLFHGFSTLKRDVDVLALGCKKSESVTASAELDASNVTELADISYEFDIVNMTQRRSLMTRRIPTVRVVAILVLAANRLKKIMIEQRVINSGGSVRGSFHAPHSSNYNNNSQFQTPSRSGSSRMSWEIGDSLSLKYDGISNPMTGEAWLQSCQFCQYRYVLKPDEWMLPSHAELEHLPLNAAIERILVTLTAPHWFHRENKYHKSDSFHDQIVAGIAFPPSIHQTPPPSAPSSSAGFNQRFSPQGKSLLQSICNRPILHSTRSRGGKGKARSDTRLRIWYRLSGALDLFAHGQITLLQHALISISKQLRTAQESNISIGIASEELRAQNWHYAHLLDEAVVAMRQQGAAIELLDRQRHSETDLNSSIDSLSDLKVANEVMISKMAQACDSPSLSVSVHPQRVGQILAGGV